MTARRSRLNRSWACWTGEYSGFPRWSTIFCHPIQDLPSESQKSVARPLTVLLQGFAKERLGQIARLNVHFLADFEGARVSLQVHRQEDRLMRPIAHVAHFFLRVHR